MSDTKKILTTFLRRLTNLSVNNRTLFLPRLSGNHFVDLHSLSYLEKDNAFAIVAALIARKKKVICAVADPRVESVNHASEKLKRLQRLDEFLYEERGTRDLHVGWPFVRGKLMNGTPVRCPLLFFPVQLSKEKNSWCVKLREGAEITFNKSFLLAYAFYHQLPTDDVLLDETFEDSERDSTVFRTHVYQLLQKSNVEINFNADNFRDELTAFQHFNRDEFDQEHFDGQLKLFPEAVLGIFPQSSSYLIPDYVSLIENETISDIETFFGARHGEELPQASVKEEKIFPAFPMDAWQEQALKSLKGGASLVVQGPPGTGKSQLICNLIADGLANGKKILVVSQKRAALDVVYNRLAATGIEDFVALVHDFKNDRREIFRKTAAQIDRVDDYKARNISIDAIQLERKFMQISKSIDQITEELDEFKKFLFDESDCGYSAKSLYLMSNINADVTINVKAEFSNFPRQKLEDFNKKIKDHLFYAARFAVPDHPWCERKPFAPYTLSDYKKIDAILQTIAPAVQQLQDEIERKLSTRPDWAQCEAFAKAEPHVAQLLELLDHRTVYQYLLNLIPYPDDETSALWLANCARMVSDCFKEEGVETSLRASQLGSFQLALRKTMRMRRYLSGRIYWGLFARERGMIKRALVANKLTLTRDGLLSLERKLDNRLNLEHNLSKLKAKAWLADIPEKYTVDEFDSWFAHYQTAIRAKLLFNQLRGLKNFINPLSNTQQEFISKVTDLFAHISAFQKQKENWLTYLLPSQLERIATIPAATEALRHALQKDFDALCEFDLQAESLSADERALINKLFDAVKAWDAEVFIEVLNNSMFLAWLDYLESKHPVLRIPSSGRLFNLETQLRELVEEKEKISIDILLLRAREKVTEELEFNRLNNRITYRDLQHQVTKKKKIWPVRKVINQFEDEVFKLLPCWLASPEAASAIFPLREVFDLVIFDEASQCFAEQGIPALYRARQAMVAGDKQQLQPSDLYKTRWHDDDDSTPDTEMQSLLDLAARYLPSVTLQGHYRSKTPELITFSNLHFYGNQLQLLPDRHVFNTNDPPIEYHQVDGIWEGQSNATEAGYIAELVLSLAAQHPQKDIGIVTFNATQQALIQDVLDEKVSAMQTQWPSGLIIKNIENVQGDERDIIIFSIGYARDRNQKLQAYFGSLNLAGGENRLNVAVTRAREKIFVVASILPEDLSVENSLHPGPKLLKEYLAYARKVSAQQAKPLPENGKAALSPNDLRSLIVTNWNNDATLGVLASELPFADLLISHSEKYIGALLTDDKGFFNSLTAKAWHAQIPRILGQKNWRFNQLYSRNYWIDPARFGQDIERFFG